jgi:membrane protease YdiL (CAAX protease family)
MSTSRAPTSGSFHLALALLVPALLFLVNLTMHNLGGVADSRFAYVLVVVLGPGIVLPTVTLAWLGARHGIEVELGGRFATVKIAGALAVGVALAAFPVGRAVAADPMHALHLFVWLLPTSIVEVLVFVGICYNVAFALLARIIPWWLAIPLAALFASALFGLYHFSYSPPWNTPALALTVGLVWLEVSAVYVFTRSLWAAIAFNNTMAVVGFILNRVTALDGKPLAVGLAIDALLVAMTLILARRARAFVRRPDTATVAA